MASIYFYASWNVRYIILIFTTILSTYAAGFIIQKSEINITRKIALIISFAINIGILCLFKYYKFTIESLNTGFNYFHINWNCPIMEMIIPIGISFYTFQALGYVVDVYKGGIKNERHLGTFSLYIMFFPQLVAGPIERANRLIPQLRKNVRLDITRISDGLTLMLWGFFKKLVIADRLALFVDSVYNTPGQYSSTQLLIATYFFAYQIYCDFSGYSDIAIGAAKVMGIDLMENFNRPYFAKNIREFWHRWHISLSTWFRDYLYISLGGNRVSGNRTIINILIVFAICGFWHGGNWTFILWGLVHGFFLMIHFLTQRFREKLFFLKPSRLHDVIRIFVTFNLISFAWIFFRAKSLSDSILIIKNIMLESHQFANILENTEMNFYNFTIVLIAIVFMEIMHSFQGNVSFSEYFSELRAIIRWPILYFVVFSILIFGVFNLREFIYFQF